MQANPVKQYLEFLQLSGIQDVYFKEPEIENTGLQELSKKYKNCKKCALYQGRIKFVYGEGNPNAKLMLIGEAPGADENESGKPFVGKAGQLLTRMLQAIKLKRNDVYIANVMKCRPPGNRNPLPNEIDACIGYLKEQIKLIKPELILLLGKVAATSILQKSLTLTKFRENTYFFEGIKTYVSYHPSALLRNEGWKKYAWIDLKKVRDDYNKL